MGRPATDKKERLIDAAMRRFHHDGVAASSLASVANDAGVPTGNVFYYFQSKEALTSAVINRWCDRVNVHLAAFEIDPDPLDRIAAFLRRADQRRQDYADAGCPLAALGSDLRQASAALSTAGSRPLMLIRSWLAVQFDEALGKSAQVGHADFCLASLQGSYALAHASRDPAIISHCVNHLLEWIGTLRR